MEIVRAQPFFSRHSLILRDQLEEYVNGFPATRAHRQIIAKAYNMKSEEIGFKNDVKPSQKMTPKSKQQASTSNLKDNEPESDLIASLIPPNSDLPVDPDRLKKAIKNALIKNDNKPEKIDIQSIMREQVRIYK